MIRQAPLSDPRRVSASAPAGTIGIVGASGFIGRSLADHLAEQGLAYRAFVRDRTKSVLFPGKVDVVTMNLDGPIDLSAFSGLETLVLAASATRPNSPGNTQGNELLRNVLPQIRLIEALRETSLRHLIYLSSGGAIYGNQPRDSVIAEPVPRNPCDAYGYGKLCMEAAIEMIWQGQGPDYGALGGPRRYTILRPSNPVGPHQLQSAGTHGLVSTVLHHIRHGLAITVQGDGSTVRDFFSVHDLSRLILRVTQGPPRLAQSLASDRVTSNGSCILNVSSGQGYTILDVIARCAESLGLAPEIHHNAAALPAIPYNVLCNDRAARLFDWQPRWSMPDILAEFVHSLRNQPLDKQITPETRERSDHR